ncbi:hypothetical protein OIO90_002951 [Microbotryomycetes sp. JL221]|nr:hypothetical protein OIO90_002951 [Microbotryomycetes sp. JL221]
MESDSASLAQLTHQLVSLGFVTRSFDLALLFPSTHANSKHQTEQDLFDKQRQLQLQHKTKDQLVRCLWNMLTQHNQVNSRLEDMTSQHKVMAYEFDRLKLELDKSTKLRHAADKDKQAAETKFKTASANLSREQDRHRHARDELVKARSALQFVKTQALHDQKRREAEMASTMARLQRLTTDATQSKFVILNSQAVAKATSKLPSATSSSTSSTANIAQVQMLQSALDECDKERRRCEQECAKLRGLIGQVDHWSDEMLTIETIALQRDEDKRQQDESFHIPNPHLVLPVQELTIPLHRKLDQIKSSITTLSEATETRIEQARFELVEELERERSDRRDVESRRREIEVELELAKDQLIASEQLVQDFTTRQAELAQQMQRADSDDEEPAPPVLATLSAELDRPVKTFPKREETSVKARLETKRSKDVASFLADLNIDTPREPVKVVSRKLNMALETKDKVTRAESRARENKVRDNQSPPERVATGPRKSPRPETKLASTRAPESRPRIQLSSADNVDKPTDVVKPMVRTTLTDILSMSNSPPLSASTRAIKSSTAAASTATTTVSLTGAAAKIAAARERALAGSSKPKSRTDDVNDENARPRQRFGELSSSRRNVF